MQNVILPSLILITVGWAALKKVNVFEAFIEGAKNGINTVFGIFPTLCALFFVIGIFRASGTENLMTNTLSPVAKLLNLPSAVIPLFILRPLSGSGAVAYFTSLVQSHGADSLVTRVAATMLGSSETTFYTVSVYYGAAGVKKSRYTVPCALIGDITAFIMSGVAVSLFFK